MSEPHSASSRPSLTYRAQVLTLSSICWECWIQQPTATSSSRLLPGLRQCHLPKSSPQPMATSCRTPLSQVWRFEGTSKLQPGDQLWPIFQLLDRGWTSFCCFSQSLAGAYPQTNHLYANLHLLKQAEMILARVTKGELQVRMVPLEHLYNLYIFSKLMVNEQSHVLCMPLSHLSQQHHQRTVLCHNLHFTDEDPED